MYDTNYASDVWKSLKNLSKTTFQVSMSMAFLRQADIVQFLRFSAMQQHEVHSILRIMSIAEQIIFTFMFKDLWYYRGMRTISLEYLA